MASIVEKNITSLITGLAHGLTTSTYVDKKGILQQLDPRTKVLGGLSLIILASWSHSTEILIFLYIGCLLLGLLSKIPLKKILHQWYILPFFSLFLALPLIFSFVTRGHEIVTFSYPFVFSITSEGVALAVRFLIRIATTVTIVQLVLLTTRWDFILKALGSIGIPHGFLFVLALTYRYIYVFISSALDMILAKKSRTVGKEKVSSLRSWIGALSGSLFMKSIVMSRDVHEAMISRGFTGKVKTLKTFSFQIADWVSLFIILIITGGAIVIR